jgi:23S rRNA-/tRNA-specific pseudouridylate synthase
MGLVKTSSAVAYYGRAASAGPGLTLLSTTTQSRRTCGRPPVGVLYIDRGVIVLNKPPGLVSQGTSSSVAPVAAKSHVQEKTTLPSRTAFDDVLDGTVTVQTPSLLLPALTRRRLTVVPCSSHPGLRRAYGLSTNLYPVHRLDKVRNGTQKQGHRCLSFLPYTIQ